MGGVAASTLVVNKVGGVRSTSTVPACGSLRGEPCRALVAEGNEGFSSRAALRSGAVRSHRHQR